MEEDGALPVAGGGDFLWEGKGAGPSSNGSSPWPGWIVPLPGIPGWSDVTSCEAKQGAPVTVTMVTSLMTPPQTELPGALAPMLTDANRAAL